MRNLQLVLFKAIEWQPGVFAKLNFAHRKIQGKINSLSFIKPAAKSISQTYKF